MADLVLDLAIHDPSLWRTLESDVSDADESDEALIARYRRRIDDATDDEDIDYSGAGSVAAEIEAIRARLAALADAGRIAPAFALAQRLVEGLRRVVEAADDSEGEIHAAGARILALHARLCLASGYDPLQLADDLFECAMDSTTDLFADAIDDYRDALGPAGLAEFRRLAQAAWGKLPAKRRDGFDGRRSTLKWMLDRFAQEEGDLAARIELRKPDLIAPQGYCEIAQLCLDAGQEADALRWLEDGLWCFEGTPDRRLTQMAATLMTKAGRQGEAADLLASAFERDPRYDLYLELRRLGGPQAVERMLGVLRRAADRAGARAWYGPGPLLFDVLVAEGRLDEAWTCAAAHRIGGERLRNLADASAESHRAEAVAAYERLAEELILAGGAPAYDAAVRHVRRRGEIARDAVGQAAYLAALRLRHKARRTLIPRLASLDGGPPVA